MRTAGGASGKLAIHVDDIPQQVESEPNDQAAQANLGATPVGFWGVLDQRGDVDHYALEFPAGVTIVAELSAGSIESKANATLALFDPQGNPVATNNDFDGQSDPLIGYTTTSAGRYTVRVADLVRSGSGEHFYRFSVGKFPYVTGVYPLSVPANAQAEVELTGFNVPAGTKVSLAAGGPGELAVPVDANAFRTRRGLKVVVGSLPETVEAEPNDEPAKATPISAPGAANGRIRSESSQQPAGNVADDSDLFRFESKAGQTWIIETDAARRGSPLDARIAVLHADGRPVERLLLQAVRDSYIDFKAIDSSTRDVRLKNWEEMELNQYLYLSGEVTKLFRMPQGPDSGFLLYESAGKRRCYFDTSAVVHANFEPAYIVEPRPTATSLVASGLPVFTLPYANDDDGERRLGTDSRLTFAAPADGSYLVRVNSSSGQSGDRYSYRLIVREPKPDFSVSLAGANPAVGADAGKEFTVSADRLDGFDGDIKVDIAGVLPEGFGVSTPLVIEAGHNEAKGVIYVIGNPPQPAEERRAHTKVTATAVINGQSVTRDVNNLGTISLAAKPKLTVRLLPTDQTVVPGQVPELSIAPGSSITALIRVERNGFNERVELNVDNLPHGVIVDNIGLSGVLIPPNQTERQIFITAAPWVPESSRLVHAQTKAEGGQASPPLMLHVRKK